MSRRNSFFPSFHWTRNRHQQILSTKTEVHGPLRWCGARRRGSFVTACEARFALCVVYCWACRESHLLRPCAPENPFLELSGIFRHSSKLPGGKTS
jgi:hypothetical protein